MIQIVYTNRSYAHTGCRDSSIDPALGEFDRISSTLEKLSQDVSAPTPGGGRCPAYIAVRPITHQHTSVIIRVHLSQRRGNIFKTSASRIGHLKGTVSDF